MTTSAFELTFFLCQLLTTPTKSQFQDILNENDLEKRMKLVTELLAVELSKKRANKEKIEAMNKKVKERFGGGEEDGQDEISEL